ncbi:MAG: tetratricopeptide repeat protein, partial [Longimicrobiales bacterium]
DWVGAEREIRRALELERSSENYRLYAFYLQAAGRLEALVTLSDSLPLAVAGLGYVYARAERTQEARRLLSWLDRRFPSWFGQSPELLSALGEIVRAVALLQDAYQKHPSFLINLRCMRVYEGVRNDPRIKEIERGTKFPS